VIVERMIVYFESMVDSESKRFYLLSHPQFSEAPRTNVNCPLRDMGSAWDAVKAVKILKPPFDRKSNTLVEAILQTTDHYSSTLVTTNGAMHLSPEILGESPNIAHNALLLLALVESESLGLRDDSHPLQERIDRMDGLASGILKMQRPDGAFATQFLQPTAAMFLEELPSCQVKP